MANKYNAAAKKAEVESQPSPPSSSTKVETDYPNYHQYLGKIVLLQAIIRGHITRKNYPRSLFIPNNHSPYRNDEPNNQPIDPSYNTSPEEKNVQNFKFPNGAVYTGIPLYRNNEKQYALWQGHTNMARWSQI